MTVCTFLIFLVLVSIGIFLIPLFLYLHHSKDLDIAKTSSICPKGSSILGCKICKYDEKIKNYGKIFERDETELIKGLKYHIKVIYIIMYKYALNNIVDIGAGIKPSAIIDLKIQIPCLMYSATKSVSSVNDLDYIKNLHNQTLISQMQSDMIKAFQTSKSSKKSESPLPPSPSQSQSQSRISKLLHERPDVRSSDAWIHYYILDFKEKKYKGPINLPAIEYVPLEQDLVYLHHPLDKEAPQMVATYLIKICASNPNYLLIKHGLRDGPFKKEPLLQIHDSNYRGDERFFLVYQGKDLCFSYELAEWLSKIPARTSISSFVGDYHDPNHPQEVRHIRPLPSSGGLLLSAASTAGGSITWKLPLWVNPQNNKEIRCNFAAKGGPEEDLKGQYLKSDHSIHWNDGNIWTKVYKKKRISMDVRKISGDKKEKIK